MWSVNIPDYPLGHKVLVTALITSNDSKWVATASIDGTIIIWDVKGGTVVQEWAAHDGHHPIYDLAFSPDSGRVLSAGGDEVERLIIWDVRNGVQKVAVLKGHTEHVHLCAWSPDGTLIASASTDGTMRIWDGHTFQERDLYKDKDAYSCTRSGSLQFSPDGSYLAWRCESPGRCTIWRPLMTTEQPKVLTLRFSGQEVNMKACPLDPDSTRTATAHGGFGEGLRVEEYVVQIWDVASGAAFAVLAGHSRLVTDVSFSPDGRLSLLSASEDGYTNIWDADSWEETVSFVWQEKKSATRRARLSPDGRYIATGSRNGIVRLWKAGNVMSCAAVFTEHTTDIRHVAFTLDGNFLASGDEDGVVLIRRISDFIEDWSCRIQRDRL